MIACFTWSLVSAFPEALVAGASATLKMGSQRMQALAVRLAADRRTAAASAGRDRMVFPLGGMGRRAVILPFSPSPLGEGRGRGSVVRLHPFHDVRRPHRAGL